jgi:DNA-directed RNA polymerase beta subunit
MIDFTAHPLFPDLLENQRRSVQYFLEKGILEELELFSYLAARPLSTRNSPSDSGVESRGQVASHQTKPRKEFQSNSFPKFKGMSTWWLRPNLSGGRVKGKASPPPTKDLAGNSRYSSVAQHPNSLELILHASKFVFKKPQFSQIEAIRHQKTYSAGLYIPVEVREANQSSSSVSENSFSLSSTLPRWFYFGDIPLMTERGSFLINGAPRVLVNQIVRCPSVYFKLKLDDKNRRSYIASFLSDYGSWLRLETDRLRPRLWVRIDKSPRFPIELLLTSLGFGNFGETPAKLKLGTRGSSFDQTSRGVRQSKLGNSRETLLAASKRTGFIKRAPSSLGADAEQQSIQLIWKKCNPGRWGSLVGCYSFLYNKFFNPRRYSLGRVGRLRLNKRLGRSPECKLPTLTPEDVLLALDYLIDLQNGGGTKPTAENFARSNDLAQSSSSNKNSNFRVSGARKFSNTSEACIRPLPHLDDIDHLKNRRVRLPGEIIQNQFRLALSRVLSPSSASLSRSAANARAASSQVQAGAKAPDQNLAGSPQKMNHSLGSSPRNDLASRLVSGVSSLQSSSENRSSKVPGNTALDFNTPSLSSRANTLPLASLLGGSPPQAFVSTLRELFNTSQLSQYMDQTNPLAEITHKRRLSSLGPGGVGRDQAGFAVREIHPSHFGRICPIETPEGQNAGLVGSLASYARINENGFLQSPLQAVPLNNNAWKVSQIPASGKISGIAHIPFGAAGALAPHQHTLTTSTNTNSFEGNSNPLLRNSYLFPAEVEDEIYLCTADIGRAIESVLYPNLQKGFAQEGALSDLVNSSSNLFNDLGENTQSTKLARRRFLQDPVPMRYKQEFITTKPNRIQFRGVCPVQMISVATSLIPFLEHDDANRALMGSNMQRQAVPLMLPEKPLVGTGFELQAARDSSTLLLAPQSGYVTSVDSTHIELNGNWISSSKASSSLESEKFLDFNFINYSRSNQSTCIRQRPAVQVGEWVEKGDLLADGSATQDGELALGKNILLAYIPWEGYNFEDALVINERLVYEDIYSSLHIERYELDVRNISPIQFRANSQTGTLDPCLPIGIESQGKLNWPPTVGTEYITRDLSIISGISEKGFPFENSNTEYANFANSQEERSSVLEENSSSFQSAEGLGGTGSFVSEPRPPLAATLAEQIRQLDQDGIIKPGVWVEEGSILVGKLTAQVGTNSRKGGEPVRRNGSSGRQSNSSRTGVGLNAPSRGSATPEYRLLLAILGNEGTANYSSTPGEGRLSAGAIRPSGSLKQSFIRFQNTSLKAGIGVRGRVIECIVPWRTRSTFSETSLGLAKNGAEHGEMNLAEEKSHKIAPVTPSTSLPLQIFLAHKKRIQVGDKMSGRHGNKGILSLILPPQDMPYLQDGTPVDIILNPLGVPSRMNVGQVLETLFGLAAKYLGEIYRLIPFEPQSFDASSTALRSLGTSVDFTNKTAQVSENSEETENDFGGLSPQETFNLAGGFGSPTRAETARSLVYSKLREARSRTGQPWLFDPNNPGKMQVFDGRTGEVFHQPLLVGYSYMFKLIHLVDDKIHARSTGPYSLVTQQPLGGRSKKGGQRLGEMEVWACEGFGAAYLLQEFLTVKSDEIYSRNTFLLNLMSRQSRQRLQISARQAVGSRDTIALPPSASSSSSGKSYVPESFRVLVNELQALCLSIYYNPDFRLSYPSLLGREGKLPGLSHLEIES